MGHEWRLIDKKCIVLFISFHEKRCPYKSKTLNTLGQEHQVVHDHYSFWNLKTIGNSMEVQLLSLSTWERGQSRVLCFLVFDFNHVNTQTPKCLCYFYHHLFLITLNHLGINETH